MRIDCLVGFLILACVPLLTMAGSSVPDVFGDHIRFGNGIRLYYDSRKVLFDDPDLAREKKLPVSISEKPTVIREWDLIAIVRTNHYYEGSTTELSLYDYSGELIFPVLQISGDIYFLTKQRKILMVGMAAHYATNRTFILSSEGKLLAVIRHGEIFDVGISRDENVIWFYSRIVADGVPMTRVSIFNSEGRALEYITVEKAGVVEFKYLNKTYSVDVGPPDFPG